MDQLTLQNLNSRNRKEKLFAAKCCGAPVPIRTPAGKIAHFYRLSTMPGRNAAAANARNTSH
jgi:hypothetical protein